MKPSTSNPTARILDSFHVLVQNAEGEEAFDSKAVTQFLQHNIHVYKYCINKPTMHQPHCTHAKREERVGFDAPCVFTGLMQQVCTFCHSKWDGRKMKLPNAAIVLVFSWFTSSYSAHWFSKLQGENVFQLHWTPWDNLCVRVSGPLWHVLRGNLAAQRLSKKPHPDLFMFTLYFGCV